MTTTFYLLRDEAPLPHPVTKQSDDTIYYDYAALYATYAKPGLLSTSIGAQDTSNVAGVVEPGTAHYNHFGTWVSDPLPAQTLSGTVTIGLCFVESIAGINMYPRVLIYLWRANNTYGSEILALTNSATEAPITAVDPLTVYFTTEAITETVIAPGDKIVVEVETYDNNTLNAPVTRYYQYLQFGGPAVVTKGWGDTSYSSYIEFSADIVTKIPDTKPEVVPTISINIYDSDMSLIGIIDDYEWFQWVRNWYSPDTWEMRINRYKTSADLILDSRSLSGTTWEYGGFIGVTTSLGRRIGIIERIELPLDETGKISEQYFISGRGVEGILSTRMANFGTDSGTGYDTQSTYAETAMRHYVQVACADEAGTPPFASFTASPSSGADPLYVDLINTSTGTSPLTYSWDYTDDDVEDSTDQSPTDISYNTAGSYTCRLTVTNDYGTSTTTRTITVAEAEGAPEAAFNAGGTSGTNPFNVTFIDTSTNTPLSWSWDFGDSTSSTDQNPTHTYTSIGTFTVALTATNAAGSDTETKTGYITVTGSTGIPEYGAPTILDGYALGGSYVGGGTQYPAYTAGIAGGDYDGSTITDRAGLIAALEDATSGAVIYVSPTADISMNEAADEDILIPAGVTLASNRGVGSSAGGKIWTTKAGTGWGKSLFKTGGNTVRVTGIRMEGECLDEDAEGAGEETYRMGIFINGHTGCVVDNCDLKGFAYANVFCYGCATTGRPWVHHNYIHHSHNQHEGYGVNVEGGDALVEGNVFEHNRHSMTGGGQSGENYTFRYNTIDDDDMETTGRCPVDVHERATNAHISGGRYDIYNNTYIEGQNEFVKVTSPPEGAGHFIHHNIMYCDPTQSGMTAAIVYQYDVADGHAKMYATYNKWVTNPGETLVTYADNTTIVQYKEVDVD